MDYKTEDGRNLIKEWYDSEDYGVQAQFDAILDMLEARDDWDGCKKVCELKRKHVGLSELRFSREGNSLPKWRYRPVGFFILNYREFVLVLGCKKWLGLYVPPGAFDTALDFKWKFEEGRGSIHEHS